MNNLSWFIYLTQIVDAIGTAAMVSVVLGGIGGIFGGMFLTYNVEDKKLTAAAAVRICKFYVAAVVIAVMLAIFTPSRQTMILIAGSEIGERVVKSDDVQSVVNPGMDLIRKWIKWIKQESDKIKDKS
jgi:hypothetical protein